MKFLVASLLHCPPVVDTMTVEKEPNDEIGRASSSMQWMMKVHVQQVTLE